MVDDDVLLEQAAKKVVPEVTICASRRCSSVCNSGELMPSYVSVSRTCGTAHSGHPMGLSSRVSQREGRRRSTLVSTCSPRGRWSKLSPAPCSRMCSQPPAYKGPEGGSLQPS